MNVLIISQHFWPEQFRINMIAEKLVENGINVTVITGVPNYPEGNSYSGYKAYKFYKEKKGNITIYRVPLIPRGNGSNIKLVLNYLSFMFSSTLLSPFITRKKHFDRVLVFQTSPIFQALAAILIKKLKKVPVYLWVQDLWPESLSATRRLDNKFVNKCISAFVKYIYKNSDKILIQSKSFEKSIRQYCESIEIEYMPNTCEEFYKPISITPRNFLPELDCLHDSSTFKVMFTGNVGSGQSIDTLVSAALQLKHEGYAHIKWIIVGAGSELVNLQTKIAKEELEDTIYTIGSFPAEYMPEIISHTDLCLAILNKQPIFSLTIPSKIQSYMACGKPIITAIDGEVERIIKEAKCGISVPAEASQELATGVLTLSNAGQVALSEMGKAARQYFLNNFDYSHVLPRMMAIIED